MEAPIDQIETKWKAPKINNPKNEWQYSNNPKKEWQKRMGINQGARTKIKKNKKQLVHVKQLKERQQIQKPAYQKDRSQRQKERPTKEKKTLELAN